MKKIKELLNHIFIDGLSGMATGLFATLIVGTILSQIGELIPGVVGDSIYMMGKIASSVTGAGIGCGVAIKFKEPPLVTLSAAVCGMMGAFASKILAGSVLVDGVIHYAGPGEPLGAFIAAIVGIYMGHLIAGKTKVDILVTPLCCITAGSAVGLVLGPPISSFMLLLGEMINMGTQQQPLLMGIIVSVLMGIILTLPISSAALGIILNLGGLAAGAATVGCCANMVGFAVASFRENKVSGLISQGIGTSMLQIPNIMKKPIIMLPMIVSSAILGPLSTCVFKLKCGASGGGMGTSGFVGVFNSFEYTSGVLGGIGIILLMFVLPAVLNMVISEFMRKKNWIKAGDMKLPE